MEKDWTIIAILPNAIVAMDQGQGQIWPFFIHPPLDHIYVQSDDL